MKSALTKLFSPILNQFENDSDEYYLKPLNRKVVLAIGVLMSGLACFGFFQAIPDQMGYILAPTIFSVVGFTALVVGCLGSDHAVAKLIGARKK